MPNLTRREERILDIFREGGDTSAASLSSLLQVSVVTVRSDLRSLEAKGMLVRTRGGTIPAYHPDLMEKLTSRTAEKERIAKAAADLLQDGDRVMITNGTTASLVGRYLFGRQNIHVVTNSMLLLPYGRVNPHLHVTLVGGEFRGTADASVGPIALKQLEEFHVRIAITGTDGLTIEHGLTTHLVENAEIVRKMVSQAEVKVLVTDSSKYGKVGFVKILPVSDLDIIITDRGLPGEAQADIEALGVKLILV